MSRRSLRLTTPVVAVLMTATLGACSSLQNFKLSNLNPFKKAEVRLPGKREAVLKPESSATVSSAASQIAVSLPESRKNAAWSQPGGTSANAPGHLALSGSLKTVWQASGGSGSSSSGRLTSRPIVYQGRIYTLDTQGVVSAFSASGGSRVWRKSLTPESEDADEGYGGGLAADDGRIFVATGYGTVVALDAGSGKIVWTLKLGVPMRSSPTAAGGKVFVVTTEGKLYCINASSGEELWSRRGLPQRATTMNNVSPAVEGDTVVVPYPSGDVIAFKTDAGQPLWSDSLARARSRSAVNALSDASRPAIGGGIVYAVGHAGRMIATAKQSGARIWTKNIRGKETPWVAGNMVFVVSINGQLMALTQRSGEVRWAVELPGGGRWSGPVLAGGRLWLVSSKGLLAGVDARSGKITTKRDLGESVYIAPVVAAGRMYVYTDKARLIALN